MELRQKLLKTEMCGHKSKIMIYDQEILLLANFFASSEDMEYGA